MKILAANLPSETKEGSWSRIIVRTGTRWPFRYRQRSKRNSLYYVPFPFSLATAAAVVRELGHQVEGLDALPLRLNMTDFLSKVLAFGPELILLETSAPSLKQDLSMIETLKEQSGSLIALAGAQATAEAEQILSKHPWVDFILRGEYEILLGKLAEILEAGLPEREANLPGLAGRDGSGIYVLKGLGSIDKPDLLPPPAYDLFPSSSSGKLELYRDNIAPEKFCLQVTSSRGCNQNCSFCLWNQVLYPKKPWRPRDPQKLVAELLRFKDKYNPQAFYFDDDSMVCNPETAKELFCEMIRSKLNLPWYGMVDLNGLSPALLKLMAQAGCRGIKFGVENAQAKVLSREGKRIKGNLFQIVQLANILRIRTHATFCLGMPEETSESLGETIELARQLPVDSIQCSICVPYPGTSLYNRMQEENRLREQKLNVLDGNRCVLLYPDLDAKQVEEARKVLLKTWRRKRLCEPSWLLRQSRYLLTRISRGGVGFTWDWLETIRDVQGDWG